MVRDSGYRENAGAGLLLFRRSHPKGWGSLARVRRKGKEFRMHPRSRVLLVDDDPDISLALSDYLEKEGFEIEMVETGTEALRRGTTHQYDAVLLDVGLPDRDGLEVLKEMANARPGMPVILLTAFTSLRKTSPPEAVNKAFAYLTKPFNRENVKSTLLRAVSYQEDLRNMKEASPSIQDHSLEFPSIVQPSLSQSSPSTGPRYQLTLDEYQGLAEHVHLMQFAFDHVPEGILIADSEKHIRYANQAAYEALGYTKEEVQTLRIPDIAPSHDNQRYLDHLVELRQGKTLSYYTVHRTKHGENIPIEISVYLLNFHGQEFTCAITKPSPKQPSPQTTLQGKDKKHW